MPRIFTVHGDDHRGTQRNKHRKTVMDQNVAFVVWAGIAVLALAWAQVSLWHLRRVLSQPRRSSGWQVARHASSTNPAKPHSAMNS
jgi:hypothetical protein